MNAYYVKLLIMLFYHDKIENVKIRIPCTNFTKFMLESSLVNFIPEIPILYPIYNEESTIPDIVKDLKGMGVGRYGYSNKPQCSVLTRILSRSCDRKSFGEQPHQSTTFLC